MTNALNKLLVTIGNAAASATATLLYDFSIPLGIVNLIQSLIGGNQNTPNTPQIAQQRGQTQWFSQPSAAQIGNPPKVTVYVCNGNAALLSVDSTSAYPTPDTDVISQLCGLLDPAVYDVQEVVWPSSGFPVWDSIQEGVQSLTTEILLGTGRFVLVGYSAGAAVCSQVLNSLQGGDLTPQYSRLLAGVMFGNPCRKQGSVAPAQKDPGGHGILSGHLVAGTPASWWEFANAGDSATSIGNDDVGEAIQLMVESVFSNYKGGGLDSWFGSVSAGLGSQIGNPTLVPELFTFLKIMAGLQQDVALVPGLESHSRYGSQTPYQSAQNLTSVQLAANYLNTVGTTWQSSYQYTNPVEVLQVNFKLPLSIGNLGFRILRVPCTVTAWYRDRNNNWIQLVDDSDVPVSLRISYSATGSWYTYDTKIYPVVATALQLRIVRNYDPQVGNQPFVVGIKDMLIQRYIYSIDNTIAAIPDQQDALGNVITSYIKSWGPNQALDHDPGTFWKSFPCPDPNGVVALYLDTRDTNGDPQIIDTLYIDPVYTGNALNLYYSNDSAQGTLFINPVNLPPDSQVNAFWTLGKGLFDTSNTETIPVSSTYSEMVFPVSLGPLSQKPMWIGIEWTPDFDPDPTLPQSQGGPPPYNPVLFGVAPATVAVNAVQTVTLSGSPTGGTFTLRNGFGTTGAIPYNATALQLQQALTSLASVGPNDVSVSGNAGGPWTLTFQGSLAGTDVPTLTNPDKGKNLTGGLKPSVKIVSATAGESKLVNAGGDTYWPTLYYDVGGQQLTLVFENGNATIYYHLPLSSPMFSKGQPLQIVVGWDYDPGTVLMSVTQQNNLLLAEQDFTSVAPPNLITLDGETGFRNFRGLMTALIVKQEPWGTGYKSFQLSPEIYANPNPVRPNAKGLYPSTTLDNAVMACDWTSQSLPIGGTSESWFESKVWTPIYENYTTERGKLFLPQKVLMSYLKMEFTNLTPEPYPVYDQGVEVTYDKFPVTITQQSTTPAGGIIGVAQEAASTLLTIGSDFIHTVTTGSVNWFNPQTIQNAINANFGTTQQPVVVQTGPGTVVGTLPNVSQSNVSASYRTEASTPAIYRRSLTSASSLAGQNLIAASSSSSQTLQPSTAAVAPQVVQAFSPVTTTSTSNVTAQIGQDWWLFPGLNLKMPAPVMNFITGVSNTVQGTLGTVQGFANSVPGTLQALGIPSLQSIENSIGTILYRPPSTTTRVRFSGDVIHRYDKNTLTMTAAVAYFAGINEVSAYSTSYVTGNDPIEFKYDRYDPKTFTYGTKTDGSPTITQLSSGPIACAGSPYQLNNPRFLSDLSSWTATGPWSWSPSGGLGFSSGQPSALYTCAGISGSLVSEPIAVKPNDQIVVSAWVSWSDLVLGNAFGGGASGVGKFSASILSPGQHQVPFPGLGRLSAAAQTLGQHLVPFSGQGLLSAGVSSGQGSQRVDSFPVTLPVTFPGDNFPQTFPFFFGEENVYTSLQSSGALRAEIRTGSRHYISLQGWGGLRAETRTLDHYYTTLTGRGSLTASVSEIPGTEILPEISLTGITSAGSGSSSLSSFPEVFPFTFGGTSVSFSMPDTTLGDFPDTFPFVFPGSYTATDRNSMPSGAAVGQTCTIPNGKDQGTYILVNAPGNVFSNWSLTRYGSVVNVTQKNSGSFVQLMGVYTVPPSGVEKMALSVNVTNEISNGKVNVDNVQMVPLQQVLSLGSSSNTLTVPGAVGILGVNNTTTTKFSDVGVEVYDSGLMNSDSMWARLDPLATNIDNLQLAPYVTTYPSVVPSGNWADTFGTWKDPNVRWGEPIGEVAISLDPNLVFQGNRAVHFTRAAGAGNAGIFVTQQANMLGEELCQLGCVFFKPNSNNNQITLTLRRVSDGVEVHSETFTPLVGYWYTYQSQFFELPSTLDQVYTLEFLTSGDAADELYLSNLYCNLAGIRYFLQLGDSSAFNFDITPLVYADNASVSCSKPVNQFGLTVQLFNPESWAYGIKLTPRYLR